MECRHHVGFVPPWAPMGSQGDSVVERPSWTSFHILIQASQRLVASSHPKVVCVDPMGPWSGATELDVYIYIDIDVFWYPGVPRGT